jgi:hypothetical protein
MPYADELDFSRTPSCRRATFQEIIKIIGDPSANAKRLIRFVRVFSSTPEKISSMALSKLLV